MKRMSVEDAVEITMDGIERRSQLIFAPKWVRGALPRPRAHALRGAPDGARPAHAKAVEQGDRAAQAV